jgi:uncharacterized RDD family membrane protein YckC
MSSNVPGATNPLGSFTEKLTIETPEQTALDFTIAGIGSRFVAIAFDTLIQVVVGLVVGIVAALTIAGISRFLPTGSVWGMAILVLFYFLLYFGYFPFFEIIWNGQTPGKRKAGIRVIKDSGRPLTPAECIGRNLMRIVDWLPALYAVGIVSALLTKENKRLGDLVAGSLVIRESSFSQVRPTWHSPRSPASQVLAPLGSIHLSPDDRALIDSFLNRRFDLDPMVRYRMADEILKGLKPKLTLPPENSSESEKILEALAYELRATSSYG